ncbi:hypothetical protein D7S86_24225 [Pararobbsia silviterrae]|uniref:Uncharacterized protein n=1 Tax=Pararobbsia silviterrae TaxID=1792498 RepID=A0A494X7C4_9BURK|nr:hypothetical protein D7S86_24225 [Pararobbsia silviterrae]
MNVSFDVPITRIAIQAILHRIKYSRHANQHVIRNRRKPEFNVNISNRDITNRHPFLIHPKAVMRRSRSTLPPP